MACGVCRLRLDTAHAGRDRAFARDRHKPNVAGALDMRAAAKLDGERMIGPVAPAHRDDAHFVAIFFAEQSARARFDCFVDRHEARLDRRVFQNMRVGEIFDGGELIIADRLRMGEIESEAVGRDKRALLRDVVAENSAERLMQKMRRRMVGANGAPARLIDLEFERLLERDLAFFDGSGMNENVADLFLCVGHAEAYAWGRKYSGVADLTAGFAIKRCLIEDDAARLTGR